MLGRLGTWASIGLAVALLFTFSTVTWSQGKGGGKKPPPPPDDTTAPAAVTDLAVDSVTTDSIFISWTATADDGNDPASGPAASYDVRFSTDRITDANWDSASQMTGEPTPQTSGSPETFAVNGLLPETTYYIRLKVADEVPNFSDLSNEVSATTDPGNWSYELVKTEGAPGTLVYDPDGNPSIGYTKGGTSEIKLARRNGGSWELEIVGPFSGGFRNDGVSLAYAPDGSPSFSYGLDEKIMFARKNGSTWEIEEIEDTKWSDTSFSLAYDPVDGNPSIGYRSSAKGRGNSGLKFAHFNGSTWDIETVEAEAKDGAVYLSLAYDPVSLHPAIGYSDDTSDDRAFFIDTLKFASFNGSSWDMEVVESGLVGMGRGVQLAYDPVTGEPSMVHEMFSWRHDESSLRFLVRSGSGWELRIVDDDTADSVDGTSLAYDSSGTPHVSYTRHIYSPTAQIVIAKWDGVQWVREVIINGNMQAGASLAFDPINGDRTVSLKPINNTKQTWFVREINP